MNDSTKTMLLSALNTFLATFLSAVAVTFQTGVQWTWTFWAAVGIAAVRAAVKAVINTWVPVRLGGRK